MMSDQYEALRSALRKTHAACSEGGTSPAAAVTSGAVLNEMSGETEYDPGAAYMVTASGITRIEDEDEDDGA